MNAHHAILLESHDSLSDILARFASDSVEVYVLPARIIGINEARSLVEEALRTPFTGNARLIVVEVESMTVEAQNALLKVLEEPPHTTRFLFILREYVTILPTLRSRFSQVGSFAQVATDSFTSFLQADVPTRLQLVADRIEKKDDEWVLALRTGLRAYLTTDRNGLPGPEAIRRMSYVLGKLGTRGASAKMLLEELAFSLPMVQNG